MRLKYAYKWVSAAGSYTAEVYMKFLKIPIPTSKTSILIKSKGVCQYGVFRLWIPEESEQIGM